MNIVDYCVDVASGEWKPWADFVPHVDVPSHAVLQADAVIPTVDTLRHVVSATARVLNPCFVPRRMSRRLPPLHLCNLSSGILTHVLESFV